MTESLTTVQENIETERDSPPGTPAWVKTFLIALVILLVVFVAVHITGHAPMAGLHGA